MEDQDGVESGEFLARGPEIQAYDDGVEHDAEFQDQESSDLLTERTLLYHLIIRIRIRPLLVRLLALVARRGIIILRGLRRRDSAVEILILIARVQLVMAHGSMRALAWVAVVGDDLLDALRVVVVVAVAVSVVDVPLGAEI